MERGYLKVWRKIKDSQSYNRSALHRAILLTIFVEANWKGGFFCGRQVAPGQVATSVKGLAEELREPRTNVMRALRDLEKDGMIKVENMGNKWTMITLVNWNTYQAQDEKSGQPVVNQRSTSGQPVDTIKEGKKERRKEYNTPLTPLEGGESSLLSVASAEHDCVQGTSQSDATGKGAQRSKRRVKGADLPPYTAWFEDCWKAYPRRSGKANAWRAFYELEALGEIPQDMVQRIKNRCFEPDWQRGIKNPDDERYIPHMSTWLHRRGWEDGGCESSDEPRNTPEDERRNEIMAKYNFGMPQPGDTHEDALARDKAMNAELDAAGL